MPTQKQSDLKIISINRSLHHNFVVLDTIQVGISLVGSEVKTCRSLFCKNKSQKSGSVQLTGGYVDVYKGQLRLFNVNISCYSYTSDYFNHDPNRMRILLAHKREILKLSQQIKEKGLTIVPFQMYFINNNIKLDVCVVRGKHNVDKREDLKKKQLNLDYHRRIK